MKDPREHVLYLMFINDNPFILKTPDKHAFRAPLYGNLWKK